MKLQLALDRLTWDECFAIANEVRDNIDIIEVGTGVIKEYGMAIVREMNVQFPNHALLADMKICDAGRHEANQAFQAGADVATVMAFAPEATIEETLLVAKEQNKTMMIDLLGVESSQKVHQLHSLGATFVGVHLGKDQQKQQAFSASQFDIVKDVDVQTAVAGGVTLESLQTIKKHKPDVIIVGSSITAAANPAHIAKSMKALLHV